MLERFNLFGSLGMNCSAQFGSGGTLPTILVSVSSNWA